MRWRVRASKPDGRGKTFRTRPDRHWGSPSHLHNGYWVSLPGVKRPPPSSSEAKEKVELYLTLWAFIAYWFSMCIVVIFHVHFVIVCIVVIFSVIVLCEWAMWLFITLVTGLLSRGQGPECPATGHLDTGFSWFPCVHKQMLRLYPRCQVATTCFSCSPPPPRPKFSSKSCIYVN